MLIQILKNLSIPIDNMSKYAYNWGSENVIDVYNLPNYTSLNV